MPRPMMRSYKMVINHAQASRVAAADIVFGIATGADAKVPGQTSAVDVIVPVGCRIEGFTFQLGIVNLVSVANFTHATIQLRRSGQTTVSPLVVGGDPLRNTIHRQYLWSHGADQNSSHELRFKIPKQFQRVRDGDIWQLVTNSSQIVTSVAQVIYKYYT